MKMHLNCMKFTPSFYYLTQSNGILLLFSQDQDQWEEIVKESE